MIITARTWLWLTMAALLMISVGTTIAQDAAEPAKAPEAVIATEAPDAPAEEAATISEEMFTINNLWICIAAALVFIMHLGFATLESGLTQSKNTVNILFKNVWIITSGILLYAFWGFNSMYPGDGGNGIFAIGSWFGGDLNDPKLTTSEYNEGYTWWGDFIFQAMFAATAATIVSGAVAERVKLTTFMIFAVILVGFFYPISGYWKWGGGWLHVKGFYDFAGSSVVHAFGGFAALACVLILGPRKGKYTKDGIKPIIGHSMPLATIGVFLLWLGWFGFNGGSVLSADPKLVSFVFVTTSLGACGGAVAAIFASMIVLKKPDLSMALNGILAGLVGITAGADTVSEASSIIIGGISGVLVFAAILIIDRLKIDDPVGAISVHGIGGVWGTIAVGIFSFNPEHTLKWQVIGALSISAFAFIAAGGTFFILKMIMGVRVSAEEEHEGLDVAEHGSPAYHMHG
ncbi:MAG: ammonium transporter [Verrucomicrobia bacterium]|nr:ammonium transporter [Verrucomicrobiota bacterium]